MNYIAISFLILLLFDVIKGEYALSCFQRNLYNENRKYFQWIFRNKKIVFLSLDLFALLCLFLAAFLNNNYSVIIIILAWLFYILEICRILSLKKMRFSKKSLVLSKRLKRLIVTFSLFYLFPLILYLFNYEYAYLSLLLEGIFAYFIYFILWIAKVINIPLEVMIGHYHFQMAVQKMDQMKQLEVVGITGTYGKTSTSQIVNVVLSEVAFCQSTPKNLNTLHGLITTINNYLSKKEQFFIVEIGSYRLGEVSSICQLARPKYAMITNIETIDLGSFGSMENAIQAKFELVESLDQEGIAILNRDDHRQVEYRIQSNCKKIWISLETDAEMELVLRFMQKGKKFMILLKLDF